MQVLSFTVPHLTPPSGNHYKKPGLKRGRNGEIHLTYRLTKESKAFYEAVAILAQGQSVDPETPEARKRTLYYVQIDIWLGRRQRAADKDNVQKCGLDALQYARVIHNDNAVESCRVNFHDDDREHPRTVYYVQRLEM